MQSHVAIVLDHPSLKDALRSDEEAAAFVDQSCVCRYLRANDGNIERTAAALAATVKWRQEVRPHAVECPACETNPLSHNLRIIGLDAIGRPVMYTCFSQALNRFNPDHNTQHLMRTLEDACKILAQSHANEESCVWVVDFHGYSFIWDSNPRTGLLAAHLLAHYPERLGRAVIVDAPRMFSGTWSAIKPILNQITASKVRFVRSGDGSLEAEVASWADADLQQWLLTEIAENRHAGNQKGGKKYWQAQSGLHDARGVHTFVQSADFAFTLTSRILTHRNSERGPAPQEEIGTTHAAASRNIVFL